MVRHTLRCLRFVRPTQPVKVKRFNDLNTGHHMVTSKPLRYYSSEKDLYFDPLENPFGVLGLTPSASKDDIKAAYHSLAKKYHPDTNDGCSNAEDSFKRINEAYEGKL